MNTRLALLVPDLRGGGAERAAVGLANGFFDRGYSVDMVMLCASGELMPQLRGGIEVVDLGVERLRWGLPAMVRYLRRRRPAAMVACMWPLTVMAIWARAVSRVRVRLVVAEHTTWSRSDLLARWSTRMQVRWTMHHFFPAADAVVAVSQGAADDLARFADIARDSIAVIYNPVVDETAELPGQIALPADWSTGIHKKVLAVGTLAAVKDHATLLDGFALLRRNVDAKLLILGEGSCRAALEDQIARLGLASHAFLPGFVHHVGAYYCAADLHVLTSVAEGLPTVIIEALAAGTPTVSTDCPSGPREILQDGRFGRLVPPGNAEALAAAMESALKSGADTLALKGRAQDFSVRKAVDRYEQILFPDRTGGFS